MARIAAIILVLFMPETIRAGVVLKAGEIDSSKVKVGAYAEVIYGMGGKLSTAHGYIQAVDAESLTISQGLRKRIALEQIQQLILAESSFAMDRLKKTTHILFVRKENKPRRIVGKLVGGVLGGGLIALVGGTAAAATSDCTEDQTFCKLADSLTGGWFGYLVGVPIGMNQMDSYDRFTYSLAGSLIGGAASLVIFTDEELAEKLWPALVISPLVGAVIMSEFSRELPEDRRVSIGLLPGPQGSVSAVATLRF